jgi:hypothetical protein
LHRVCPAADAPGLLARRLTRLHIAAHVSMAFGTGKRWSWGRLTGIAKCGAPRAAVQPAQRRLRRGTGCQLITGRCGGTDQAGSDGTSWQRSGGGRKVLAGRHLLRLVVRIRLPCYGSLFSSSISAGCAPHLRPRSDDRAVRPASSRGQSTCNDGGATMSPHCSHKRKSRHTTNRLLASNPLLHAPSHSSNLPGYSL